MNRGQAGNNKAGKGPGLGSTLSPAQSPSAAAVARPGSMDCNSGKARQRRRKCRRVALPVAGRDGSRRPTGTLAEQALHPKFSAGVTDRQ